jgi:competence protein ComEC
VANEASGQSRARAGVRTWPVERARRAFGAASPGVEFAFPARLREWAALEVAAGRLLPWFAVSFGAGIVLYFTAEHEPAVWAASGLAAIGVAVAIFLRGRPVGFVLALGFLAFAAGFAVATFKTALIAHPVLRYPAYGVSLAGFVELREESQKTDRFVLRVDRIAGNRIVETPQRVRLSVRRGKTPPAGAFVEVKAQLNPPLQPLRPGSYDFARDLYFQRLGASGFVHGAIKIVAPPVEAGWRLRANAHIQGLRDAIDFRIRSVLSGDVGSIASALITGKRDAISEHLYDSMFVSGIGHVLSISGYHMAVVRGRGVLYFPRVAGIDPGPQRTRANQKMVGVRGAAGDDVLSGPLRRRGRDATFVYYDSDRAHRRAARSSDPDAAHRDHCRIGGVAVCAGSRCASEFPDVVCSDAGSDRGL